MWVMTPVISSCVTPLAIARDRCDTSCSGRQVATSAATVMGLRSRFEGALRSQSDPTKAVNGAAELTNGQKVSVVFGPVNSGESLAVVPLLARANTPQIHPCWVDALTDPKKYPMCFRNAPTNQD